MVWLIGNRQIWGYQAPRVADLELKDALKVGGGTGGHECEEVVDENLRAAADHLEQRLGLAHLARHVTREARMRHLIRLA